MAAKSFLRLVAGKYRQIVATVVSAGASNGGDIVALDDTGKLDQSVMPTGIGANTNVGTASEALTAGNFVQFYNNAGAVGVRKADNSNNRPADGYVRDNVANGAQATVYPLDGTNANLTGLTPGADYWLGTAGGVIATPLDESLAANQGSNKVSQYLGKAQSSTALITTDSDSVVL
jgi:acyl-homoserine lactone acylase PvdQ